MKLKTFNLLNSRRDNHASIPKIRINKNSGLFLFNKAASDILGLNHESKIEVHNDEEKPKEWFVSLSNSPEALSLYKKQNTESLVLNSIIIAKELFQAIGSNEGSLSFLLSKTPVQHKDYMLFPIITASAKP